jgi:ABC-2 type transport system ATP-binding protein
MKIKNVTYRYKNSDRKVLDDLNITFEENKMNVILGLNGAGKTTLFDLISGTMERPEGFIGFPNTKDILYQVQGVGFLTTLKGKDLARLIINTDYRSRNNKSMQEIFESNLNSSEIKLTRRIWEMKFGDMSPGERRWLIMNGLCSIDRTLYLFDEPTVGLDPTSRLSILKRLNRLAESEGKAVLYSTHILHELENISAKIYLLHEGSVKFSGTYEEFLREGNTDNPDIAFKHFTEETNNLNEAL